VRENLLLAMDLVGHWPAAERMARATQLLQRAGLADQVDKLPSTLSGGQQQRAAIARALANDPPLLLADEPTGNLDSETAEAMARLFDALAAEGKTLLLVTHDAQLAQRAQRVLRLKDGVVVVDERAAR
ncbi:MAG: ATP-binding cassette domain-containing protein, partial [Burkholderiales bacterium]|nr:ATP-binding cassette domain-containing protein [Burkholderiales bacterium]